MRAPDTAHSLPRVVSAQAGAMRLLLPRIHCLELMGDPMTEEVKAEIFERVWEEIYEGSGPPPWARLDVELSASSWWWNCWRPNPFGRHL